ncbi:uncharacterized protein [Venturia canescens]|uniref:uncharacterized protein n=1 Tax=Venturia canescens TaxID=32260 RepID=UPI001C9D1E2F|nr:uncharacterized protein LOC122412876 [Venturia canescens]
MTTNSCVVPTCNTGCKSIKEKRSVFKVPSNIELRKKWIAAIPGIIDLMPSQFVCEKHFLECYIRKKWTKCDSDGRVIAEASYSHAQLDPMAVPSEFDNSIKMENDSITEYSSPIEKQINVEHNYCSWEEKSIVHKADHPMNIAIDTSTNEEKEYPVNKPLDLGIPKSDTPVIHLPLSTQSLTMNCSIIKNENEIINPPVQDVENNKIVKSEASIIKSIQDQQTKNDNTPEKHDCHFYFSEVTFICTTEGTMESISIPKRWAVCQLMTDNCSVLLSYYVTKRENGDSLPVMERNVKLSTNKELRYYVYGRVVDVGGWSLPQVLNDVGSLPQALEKFKNTNLCNGLGAINHHHLSSDNVFKDYVDRWHHKNCTLISKFKRCAHCIKMRGAVLKRELRLKTVGPPKRISQSSNPIDQAKLIALRKKNACERRMHNRAQQRIRSLTKA